MTLFKLIKLRIDMWKYGYALTKDAIAVTKIFIEFAKAVQGWFD